MKNIIKYGLLTVALLPVSSYSATYDAIDAGNESPFEIEKFGPRVNDKSQRVISLIKKAEAAFKKGNIDKSEQMMLQALTVIKGNLKAEAKVISTLGGVYGKQQHPEKLLPLANDLLKRYPEQTLAFSTLAGAQIANKQYSKAEQTLKKIIKQEAKDTNHRLLLVDLLLKDESKEKAVDSLLNDVLKIQKNNAKALLIKTKLQIKAKKFPKALETINVIAGFYPKESFASQLKADLNLAKKDYKGALIEYQKAYQINPTNKILFLMVDLMKVLQKESAAFELLNNELAKDNKNLPVHLKLGTIYQQQKNYPQAEKHFKAILNEQPNNIVVLNNLAWNYLQQGKVEALVIAKRAYEKAPKVSAIADTYGMVLLELGDKKTALDVLKIAAKSAPKAMDIQYHLALAYSENSEKSDAVNLLQELTKQKQSFPEKKLAIELLRKLKAR